MSLNAKKHKDGGQRLMGLILSILGKMNAICLRGCLRRRLHR